MARDSDTDFSRNHSRVPRLASRTYYNVTAPIADSLFRVGALIDGVDPRTERRSTVECLDLAPDDRVLEVGVGTGRNVSFMAQAVGPSGATIGIDMSRAMLNQCAEKPDRVDRESMLVEADALHLPIERNVMDAVLHFGGLTAFRNPAVAIEEMLRVARPKAPIVICDKSLPETRPRSLRQRFQVLLKPQLDRPPPLDVIPLPNDEIWLDWMWDGSMYRLRFENPA